MYPGKQDFKYFFVNVLVGVFFVSILSANPASADTIPGVFSSGVDDSGNLLLPGTLDPHYTITASPSGPSGAFAVGTTISSGWVPNLFTLTAQWINPTGNGAGSFFSPGTYDYVLSFNLADGLDPSTAQITGTWSPDDGGTIFLNGASTGITIGSLGFQNYNAFTISSGFQSGVNTLDFQVNNIQSQSGLLV